MRERGASRSSPPAARAKSVPDTAVTNGVQRAATGTPTVTPRRDPNLLQQIRDCLYNVAGQGFESWKASADGFTVRSQQQPNSPGMSARPVGPRFWSAHSLPGVSSGSLTSHSQLARRWGAIRPVIECQQYGDALRTPQIRSDRL
jgi:hypothetical protein